MSQIIKNFALQTTIDHAVDRHTGLCQHCLAPWPCRPSALAYLYLLVIGENATLFEVNETLLVEREAMAREAARAGEAEGMMLAKVRTMHEPVPYGIGDGLLCSTCHPNIWPCETAQIVYSAEEIAAVKNPPTVEPDIAPGVPLS